MLHRALDRSGYVAVLSIAALLLAGCPGNSATPAASPPAEPAATVALLASPMLPATEVPTAAPTPTDPPPTATPTQPLPTSTATATSRPPTPTAVAPTDTPTLAPTGTSTAAPQPQTVRSANLRAGPGTNYAVVGSAAAQQAIEPLGRNAAGDWLQIQAAAGEAWIAAFLVENIDAAGLPERESTAPTVTPVPAAPAATPAPATQALPATGTAACGVILPAPADLRLAAGTTTVMKADITGYGTLYGSWTQKNLTWRWDGLDQVRSLDWYFDLQVMLGGQAGNPMLRTLTVTPRPDLAPVAAPSVATVSDGLWIMLAPGSNSSGGADPNFFTVTCPAGEPRCPLHVRVQVALRDSSGNFACFISPPSNAVPLPLP